MILFYLYEEGVDIQRDCWNLVGYYDTPRV